MKSAIATSDPAVAEHAAGLLDTGAVEAVVAAVLIAAARDGSVLFGPLQILVGGAGTGLFAIDGRVRQPGLGVVRPRGFREEDAIPAAAYVGVPAFAGAAFAALALSANDATQAVFSPAISAAKTISKSRAELLDRIARHGAVALAETSIAGELVAAAGRVAGGLLTQEDLASCRPEVGRCLVLEHGSRRVAIAPWSAPSEPSASPSTKIEVVVAADARGQIAAACYETAADAVSLGAFDLSAPRCASPVLRGEERTRPGEPLAAFAPIAITLENTAWRAILGVARAMNGGEIAQAFASAQDESEIENAIRAFGAAAVGIVQADARMRIVRGA